MNERLKEFIDKICDQILGDSHTKEFVFKLKVEEGHKIIKETRHNTGKYVRYFTDDRSHYINDIRSVKKEKKVSTIQAQVGRRKIISINKEDGALPEISNKDFIKEFREILLSKKLYLYDDKIKEPYMIFSSQVPYFNLKIKKCNTGITNNNYNYYTQYWTSTTWYFHKNKDDHMAWRFHNFYIIKLDKVISRKEPSIELTVDSTKKSGFSYNLKIDNGWNLGILPDFDVEVLRKIMGDDEYKLFMIPTYKNIKNIMNEQKHYVKQLLEKYNESVKKYKKYEKFLNSLPPEIQLLIEVD